MIHGLYHRGSRLGVGGKSDLDDAGAYDFVDRGRLYREKRQSVFGYGLENGPRCKDSWLLQGGRTSWKSKRCCILVNIP